MDRKYRRMDTSLIALSEMPQDPTCLDCQFTKLWKLKVIVLLGYLNFTDIFINVLYGYSKAYDKKLKGQNVLTKPNLSGHDTTYTCTACSTMFLMSM